VVHAAFDLHAAVSVAPGELFLHAGAGVVGWDLAVWLYWVGLFRVAAVAMGWAFTLVRLA
jgi:hypothetical protein